MAGNHSSKRKKRQSRKKEQRLLVALVVLLAVTLVFCGVLAWQLATGEPPASAPSSTPSTTTTTTTTVTATTTTTTQKPTTTAPTVGPAAGELLQYDPTGHYVQKSVEDWRLRLVNDWNGIDADYESSITLVGAGNRNQRVDSRILADLNAMLAAGAAHGIDVQSGYRAYAHQSTLYWRQVNAQKSKGYDGVKAQQIAGTIVKRPGYSEHNSGLAVDLGGSGNFNLDQSFENTAAYRWLMDNCADYGFILRFPKDKEDVTGVIYEAWHFRYVGKEAAHEIMQKGLCLEEYLAQNAD